MRTRKMETGKGRHGARGRSMIFFLLAALMAGALLMQAWRATGCIGVDGKLPPWGGSEPNGIIVEKIRLANAIAKINGLEAPTTPPVSGNHPTVIILIENAAHGASFTSAFRTASLWHTRLTQFDNYYNEVSMGRMRVVPAAETFGTANDGVIGPVTVASLYSTSAVGISSGYSSSNPFFVEAIRAANPYINFASFDTNHDGKIDSTELHILIYQAGYEASYTEAHTPRAWAHSTWNSGGFAGAMPATDSDGKILTSYCYCGSIFTPTVMATQGQMTHEMGHDIGLPDLYDTDGLSSGGASAGLGNHCLMATGSWGTTNEPDSTKHGDTPVHIDAYYKNWLGWETQAVVTAPVNMVAGRGQAKGNNQSARINVPGSSQFFIVENRQQVGYDAGLPGTAGGLIIYHGDESMLMSGGSPLAHPNNNPFNMGIQVEQANGSNSIGLNTNRGSDTDYFRAGNNTSFGYSTNPNSRLKSGSSSGVTITNVSASSSYMTFYIGTPPPLITAFSLNGGNVATQSRTVILNNVCTRSIPAYYMASESASFAGATWHAYPATGSPTFTITSAGNTTKYVYLKLQNSAGGISNIISDSIWLEENTDLPLGTTWQSTAISPVTDMDWFRVVIPAAGLYSFETSPGTLTNIYMELMGPASHTTFIAGDHSSGPSGTPLFTRSLAAGTYYIRAWAYTAGATGTYWIRAYQILPPAVTKYSIDSLGISTNNRQVLLNYSWSGGNPTQYMASESSSFSGAVWQAYAAAPLFNIASSGSGAKTVYFKLKNLAGESAAWQDTINLHEITLSALLVYGTDATDMNAYYALLKARGITPTTMKLADLSRADLTKFQVIILGNDTGNGSTWGTDTAVSKIVASGKPVLGLGEGGYAFFGKLTLHIGYPNGWHGAETTMAVMDNTQTVFNLTHAMGVGTGRPFTVYTSTNNVGVTLPSIVTRVPVNVALGREVSTTGGNHYTLVSESGRYMLWGYTASPVTMTEPGKNLFENVVRFTAGLGTY